jgi:hypothetical protein
MSSHVGTIIIGDFPPKKEATVEELGGQHSSSATDPNFFFEQGKPWCMLILLSRVIYHFMFAIYGALTYRSLLKI